MANMQERRSRSKSSPANKLIILPPSQLRTLHSLEESGWHLWFVRNSYYLDALLVIVNDEIEQTAVIDKCGQVTINHKLHFRQPELAQRIIH